MSRKITLTGGVITTVDDSDYQTLVKFNWYPHRERNTTYAVRHALVSENSSRREIRMHREIMGAISKADFVDHIDGDGLNNCRCNLRIVGNRQNLQNRHSRKTSIYPGVSFCKANNNWRANITYGGKVRHIGYSKSEFVAFQMYVVATVVCVS